MQYRQNWSGLIAVLREISPSLGAILGNSNVVHEDDVQVKIDVFSKFHQEQLSRNEFVKLFAQAASAIDLPSKQFVFVASKISGEKGEAASEQVVSEVMAILS